jgi:hypothetical protein
MTPKEEALAALSTCSCIVVPLESGDLAILDRNGQFIFTADPSPLIHGGIGMGGLLMAFETAINRARPADAPYYKLPIKNARPAGEYYTKHARPYTSGQGLLRTANEPPVRAAAPVNKGPLTSAAQLGLKRK